MSSRDKSGYEWRLLVTHADGSIVERRGLDLDDVLLMADAHKAGIPGRPQVVSWRAERRVVGTWEPYDESHDAASL